MYENILLLNKLNNLNFKYNQLNNLIDFILY